MSSDKKATARDLEAALARIGELQATITELESARTVTRSELGVADATIDACRVHIARLEQTCDEMTDVSELENRVAMLTNIRERLFEGSLRSAKLRASLERLASERAVEIAQLRSERIEQAERSARESVEHSDTVKRLETRVATLDYKLESANARIETLRDELVRLRDRAEKNEIARSDAEMRVLRNAEIVQALALSHRHAADAIANLQMTRMRAEFDLAARVGTAEAATARAIVSANRFREDREMLIETIALRERRIAALETTLREIARDLVRTAEAERERYATMHHALLSSKIVRLRSLIRAVFKRPLALRTRFFAKSALSLGERRGVRQAEKRKRHLRSA